MFLALTINIYHGKQPIIHYISTNDYWYHNVPHNGGYPNNINWYLWVDYERWYLTKCRYSSLVWRPIQHGRSLLSCLTSDVCRRSVHVLWEIKSNVFYFFSNKICSIYLPSLHMYFDTIISWFLTGKSNS